MRIRTERDLGPQIRRKRQALGWSQTDLASRIGVSRGWVVRVEQGREGVRMNLVLKALAVLGLALDLRDIVPVAEAVRGSIPLPRYEPPGSLQALLDRHRDRPARPVLAFTWSRPDAEE